MYLLGLGIMIKRGECTQNASKDVAKARQRLRNGFTADSRELLTFNICSFSNTVQVLVSDVIATGRQL